MAVEISNDNDQLNVNDLRIELTQTMLDLTEVHVHDTVSMYKKGKVIDGIKRIAKRLDDLGIQHSFVKQAAHGG